MTTNFQVFEQLTDALESGDYSRMAKSAKLAGIFSGQAPNKATLTAKIEDFLNANVSLDSDTDEVMATEPESSPAGVEDINFDPKPTGKGGGDGEYYFWPSDNIYAQNKAGKPIEPKFDPTVWAMVKPGLPDFTDLKPAVIKAAKKAAEATKYTYNVTVNFSLSFESLDPDLGCSDLSEATLLQLLDDQGVTMPTTVTFNVVKGKVKGQSTRSTSGEGSGFYTATQRSELRPLNTVQKQILEAAASIDGCPLSDYAKYGRQNSVKLGNVCIEFKKKGYGDAIRRQNGAIFFDAGAMYDGYELSHSLFA